MKTIDKYLLIGLAPDDPQAEGVTLQGGSGFRVRVIVITDTFQKKAVKCRKKYDCFPIEKAVTILNLTT